MTTTPGPQAPRQGAAAPPPGRVAGGKEGGEGEDTAALYEETHVHGVYEAIAPHFSATRHKPWPFVSSFLASRPAGSVGLDVGCGNGKNMGINRDVVMLGCDRSAALVRLARDTWCSSSSSSSSSTRNGGNSTAAAAAAVLPGADAAVADSLDLPFRDGRADFVICIAVIHHLSTRARRVDAIRQLLRCVRRDVRDKNKTEGKKAEEEMPPSSSPWSDTGGGQVLVYVWALEQGTSRRGWDEGGEQDLLVPWVMKAPQKKKEKREKTPRAANTKTPRGQKKKTKKERMDHMQGQQQPKDGTDAAATAGDDAAGVGGRGGADDDEAVEKEQQQQQQQQQQQEEESGYGAVRRDGTRAEDGGRRGPSRRPSPALSGGEDMQGRQRQQQLQLQPQSRGSDEDEAVGGGGGGEGGDGDAGGAHVVGPPGAAAGAAAGASVPLGKETSGVGGSGGAGGDGDGPAAGAVARGGQGGDDSGSVGGGGGGEEPQQHTDKTFHRFYHLYRKGELEEDVVAAGGEVLRSGYERDNWWVIAG